MLFAATSCVVVGAVPALALDKVTLSVVAGTSLSPVYVAIDKGYFRDEGIDPELVNTAMATDSISMTASGQTDIGATAVGVSLYSAGFRGLDIKIVASMAIHPPPTSVIPVMVRKDLWDSGAIRSGKDFKGKAIAVNSPGGSIEYKLALILENFGLTLSDIREVSLGQSEAVLALQNKAVDVAILGEPFATESVRRGAGVLDVEDSKMAVGDIGSAVVYNTVFMTKRHDVAVRAMRAIIRAAQDLQANNWKTKENIDIFVQRFKIPRETFDSIAFPTFEKNLTIAKYIPSLKHQAAVHVKDKRMTQAVADNVPSMVDESIVLEATKH
jgi:NitT/TauT family transport system substrate-binding protein